MQRLKKWKALKELSSIIAEDNFQLESKVMVTDKSKIENKRSNRRPASIPSAIQNPFVYGYKKFILKKNVYCPPKPIRTRHISKN